MTFLTTYAQQHGYTLVLDVSQQQNPVLYATESTNITKAIIDAYNVKSGVPAPRLSLPAVRGSVSSEACSSDAAKGAAQPH